MDKSTDVLMQAIAGTLGPVREHLKTIEAEIEEKEQELGELRAVRTLALKIIRAADPEAPRPGPKKPGPHGLSRGTFTRPTVGRPTVDATEAYLLAHFGPGDDVNGSTLARDAEFQRATSLKKPQKVNAALLILRDEGKLRLDRQDGNRKLYRITNHRED